ncbi:MAG: hypothetical protein J0L75_01970 [Spirochaetes bacterium]|nr:hypothetical protein [Spirochaetota bacterium]
MDDRWLVHEVTAEVFHMPLHCLRNWAIFLALILTASAAPWKHPQGWWIDPPVGWSSETNEGPALIGFSDPEGLARFQVFTFDAGRFSDLPALEAFFSNRLKWSGEIMPIPWGPWSCSLALGKSALAAEPFTVIAGFWHHPELGSRVAWGTVPERQASTREGSMLSVIDSIAPEHARRYEPGLVGRGRGGFDGPRPAVNLRFGGEILRADLRPAEIESARRVVRRERDLLLRYADAGREAQYEAMGRFYRIVYRNAWSGLETFAGSLEGFFRHRAMGDAEKVGFLTGAIFLYEDGTNRSDALETPFDMLLQESGDCDSKTLFLTLLLNRLGVEGEFLFSLEDHHAFIGLPARYLTGKQTPFLTGLRGTPLVGINMVQHPVTNFYRSDRWRAIELRMD